MKMRHRASAVIGAVIVTMAFSPPVMAHAEKEVCASIYSTTGDRTLALSDEGSVCATANTSANPLISVDTGDTQQAIDGFGAAMTHSAATVLKEIDPQMRADILHDLFSDSDGAAFSMLRMPIGSSDFPGTVDGKAIHYTLDDTDFVADLESTTDINGIRYRFGQDDGHLTLHYSDASKRVDVGQAKLIEDDGHALLRVDGTVVGTDNNDVFLRVRTGDHYFDIENSATTSGNAVFIFDLSQLRSSGTWYDVVQVVRSTGYEEDLRPDIADMSQSLVVGERRYEFHNWNDLLKVSFDSLSSDLNTTGIELILEEGVPTLRVSGTSLGEGPVTLRVGGEQGTTVQNSSTDAGNFRMEYDLRALEEEGVWYDLHIGVNGAYVNLRDSDPVYMDATISAEGKVFSFKEWDHDLKIMYSSSARAMQMGDDEAKIDVTIDSAAVTEVDGTAMLEVSGTSHTSVRDVELRLRRGAEEILIPDVAEEPGKVSFRGAIALLESAESAYIIEVGSSLSNQWQPIPVVDVDPNLDRFSIDNDMDALIPMLREALAINADLSIIATAWSAPAWMKESYSLYDGRLAPQWEETYADYLVQTVSTYAQHGIPISYLTIVNEPLISGPRNYPIMQMDAQQQLRVIKHLGPKLASAGYGEVKVLVYDHNFGQGVADDATEYVDTILSDEEARQYTVGAAFHGYEMGSISDFGPGFRHVSERYSGQRALVTEITEHMGSTDFDANLMWSAQNIVIGPMTYSSAGALYWNLVLYDDGTPYFGGAGDSLGVVSVANDGSSYSLSSAYYSMAQVSAFLEGDRSARAVTTKVSENELYAQGILRSDGAIVVPIVNTMEGERKDVALNVDETTFTIDLPGQSVTTLVIGDEDDPLVEKPSTVGPESGQIGAAEETSGSGEAALASTGGNIRRLAWILAVSAICGLGVFLGRSRLRPREVGAEGHYHR